MDELNDFFHNPNAKKVVYLKGGQSCAVKQLDELENEYTIKDAYRKSFEYNQRNTDYAIEYQEKERSSVVEMPVPVLDSMESLEYMMSHNSLAVDDEFRGGDLEIISEDILNEVYNKYSFKKDINPQLVINDFKSRILDTLSSSHVSIVEGPTGCGKTTQVPQWILDNCYESRRHCNVVVTQPRRIAAISIAKRVCQERGWELGGIVGYQVGLDNKTSVDTRLQYVTTGVLLQKLVAAQSLKAYTHIILDEVHERGQEMDFLLLVIKKLMRAAPNVKIVLMSATFDTIQFANYFSMASPLSVKIEKPSPFEVKTFYLDQLHKFGKIESQCSQGICVTQEHYDITICLLNVFTHIDEEENDQSDDGTWPSVLIFLPGINEIEDLYSKLTDRNYRSRVADKEAGSYDWWVVPLHSTITAVEQAHVFQRAPPNNRKIILSTNIAESSITVPDIKYIIDYCLMKVLVADPETNFTSLQMQWASKANCTQRAGRAGRVRDGRVYRLVKRSFYENLPDECPPEMQRCPLERLVLLTKMLEMGSPKELLALAMDPPDLSNIRLTILTLKEIGGLSRLYKGENDPDNGELTYMGRIMAKLPVDVRISKLIVLGYIFGCLEEAIIMGAAMSVKNVFSNPFKEKLNAYNSKLTWADGSTSDCIAFLNVYKVWSHLRKEQWFKQQRGGEVVWARDSYIQLRALRELDDMVKELTRRLSRENINVSETPSVWFKEQQPFALKFILAGAFYPYYFVLRCSDEQEAREAVKTLSGHDPTNTLFLQGFPVGQPAEVYAYSIKEAVKKVIKDDVNVFIDKNSTKVYLSFANTANMQQTNKSKHSPRIPGKVVLSVYKGVKARQLRMDIRIKMMSVEKANQLQQSMQLDKLKLDQEKFAPRLPDIDESYIDITPMHIIDCGNFWVQYGDDSTQSIAHRISIDLNKNTLTAYTDDVRVGLICAAPYKDQNGVFYYRARVHSVTSDKMVWVFYMDYGNFGRVNKSSLKNLPLGASSNERALAIRCRLAEIQPNVVLSSKGEWLNEANKVFQESIQKHRLLAKIYSVAHGVVSLDVLLNGKISLNQLLIQRGLAQSAEESYESKMNHDLRESCQQLNLSQIKGFNKQQNEEAHNFTAEGTSVDVRDTSHELTLKGPFSPLETTVFNLMYGGRQKKVNIEWNSVNSVLLNTNPNEPFERLLVSACVGQNQTGDTLTLRHTTLMPAIPGLSCIIPLIFCPTMELRQDSNSTRYISYLCGLGHENGKPLFSEHDMLINIDVNLSLTDLEIINHIRYLMDLMLYVPDGHCEPTVDKESISEVPSRIRDHITNLLNTPRSHQPTQCRERAWLWDTEVVEECKMTGPKFPHPIFPLHSTILLEGEEFHNARRLAEVNNKLHEFIERNINSQTSKAEMACELCETSPMSVHALRIHLHSRLHKENEARLNIDLPSTSSAY